MPACTNRTTLNPYFDSDHMHWFMSKVSRLVKWTFVSLAGDFDFPYPVAARTSSTDAKRQLIDKHYFVCVANARQPNLHFSSLRCLTNKKQGYRKIMLAEI